MKSYNNVALIHDYLYVYGGAEKVLEIFHKMYPGAPIYTSYYIKNELPDVFKTYNIKESFLGKVPLLKKTYFRKFFTLLMFFAFSTFNLKNFDLVISDSSFASKGVKTSKNSFHISYIHTPPWQEWGMIKPRFRKKLYLWFTRWCDYRSAQRPNILLANSRRTQENIIKYYKRESILLYPPVEVENLENYVSLTNPLNIKDDYFVMCGRIEEYKGVSTVAKILDNNGMKMKIIGKGPDSKNLLGLSNNIDYLGFVDDKTKARVLSKAKALIFWNEEDFGISMVEALACGTPVIAFGKGGSLDIVKNRENGLLFFFQTEQNLLSALKDFETIDFDIENIKQSANKFKSEEFVKKFFSILNTN